MAERRKLYVYNIDYEASEDDLRSVFEEYGSVESVRIISDHKTGRPRGFAFVEMGSDSQAEEALGAEGTKILSRAIKVSYARDKKEGGDGDAGKP